MSSEIKIVNSFLNSVRFIENNLDKIDNAKKKLDSSKRKVSLLPHFRNVCSFIDKFFIKKDRDDIDSVKILVDPKYASAYIRTTKDDKCKRIEELYLKPRSISISFDFNTMDFVIKKKDKSFNALYSVFTEDNDLKIVIDIEDSRRQFNKHFTDLSLMIKPYQPVDKKLMTDYSFINCAQAHADEYIKLAALWIIECGIPVTVEDFIYIHSVEYKTRELIQHGDYTMVNCDDNPNKYEVAKKEGAYFKF